MIAFVGSVFSPYYAWSLRHGAGDPEQHNALNLALYGPRAKRWAMTERAARHCQRGPSHFTIGPSQLHWDGQCLVAEIEEWSVPIPRRIRGRLRLHPGQLFNFSTPIDQQQRHHWGPLAPNARIEVEFDQPAQRWSGRAYLDSNEGSEPIERACHEWDWSRSPLADGSTAVLYDIRYEDGGEQLLALRFTPDGQVLPFEAPPRQALPRTAWRLQRGMRSDGPAQLLHSLEDTPFYQRALLSSQLLGEPVTSFHETLFAPRLRSPVVQAMLPWRMPRRW